MLVNCLTLRYNLSREEWQFYLDDNNMNDIVLPKDFVFTEIVNGTSLYYPRGNNSKKHNNKHRLIVLDYVINELKERITTDHDNVKIFTKMRNKIEKQTLSEKIFDFINEKLNDYDYIYKKDLRILIMSAFNVSKNSANWYIWSFKEKCQDRVKKQIIPL
jgi:hypothetical protein